MKDQRPETIGKYKIERELGRGGMGVVYLALDDVGRRVALKVVGPRYAGDAAATARFEREIRAAARLDHKNITPVYDVSLTNDPPFFTMKLIDGVPLSRLLGSGLLSSSPKETAVQEDVPTFEVRFSKLSSAAAADIRTPMAVRAEGRTPPTEVPARRRDDGPRGASGPEIRDVVGIFAKIAEALGTAHAAGVIHRDVKPSNVLVDAALEPYVLDFGLAVADGDPGVTSSGAIVGTPEYMSPEQLGGGRIPIDHRTDIYSLGVGLYELLGGRRPFLGDSRESLYRAILFEAPAPLRRVNSSVSRDLETIVMKCLEKNPADRYADAGTLKEDLVALLELRPIAARPLGPLGRFSKLVRRRPVMTAVAGIVGVVILALGLYALHFAKAVRVERERRLDVFAARGLDLTLKRPYALGLAAIPELERWRESATAILTRYPEDDREFAGDLKRIKDGVRAVDRDIAAARRAHAISLVEHADDWNRTIERVKASPLYGGLVLSPIDGLVPLGENPNSHLQEFWVVNSGRRPSPSTAPSGRIPAGEGITLVLLSGGTYTMGIEDDDDRSDPRTADLNAEAKTSIGPFMIAKYELTEAQCEAALGVNPSLKAMKTDDAVAYPAQNLDWHAAMRALRRFGLTPPTESQWEFACRAGTRSAFSFGDAPEDLARYGNVRDVDTGERGTEPWKDGYGNTAPVGTYSPNGFGLYDMHGNVAEWCRDPWSADRSAALDPQTPLTDDPDDATPRALRGGSAAAFATAARSGARGFAGPITATRFIGVRPALTVR